MIRINIKKVLAITGMITVVLLLCTGLTFAIFEITGGVLKSKYDFVDYNDQQSSDKLHFLDTKGSDAILIESQGRFGLVDCAEDSDNPRGFKGLELEGFEQKVVDYVKSVAAVDGKVTLDFVIGTHAHSDHIGGFDTLINDPDITVKTAYLKRYYESRIRDYELEKWDNKENYDNMIKAINDNGVTLVQDLVNLSFNLGNYTVTIFNGQEADPNKKVGENENSLGVLVDNGINRAFLAGDINNIDGDEDAIAPLVGEVTILKLGHHGYPKSSTTNFLKKLNPEISIITNIYRCWYPIFMDLTFKCKSSIYTTGEMKGIILDISQPQIKCFKNIHNS